MRIQPAPKLVGAALAVAATSAVIASGTATTWLDSAPIRRVEAQPSTNAQPASDAAKRLQLTPAERDAIRREMRTMLRSLNRILHGVAGGNAEMVRTAARASGRAIALDPSLEKKLPLQYAQLDQRTHLRFDQLADASKGGSIHGNVVAALAMITGYCAACHDMFRVDALP